MQRACFSAYTAVEWQSDVCGASVIDVNDLLFMFRRLFVRKWRASMLSDADSSGMPRLRFSGHGAVVLAGAVQL